MCFIIDFIVAICLFFRPYLKGFAKVREDKENLVCSTGFAVLRAREKFNSEYLFQWITSNFFINYMISRMVGSNYPAVNTNDVFKAPVITPPLKEQQKIATILSTVDEATLTLQRLIDAKQTFKRGLMQRLFSRGIGHAEFKKTKSGLVPKNWEIKQISEVTSKITYGLTVRPKYIEDEDGIPLISAREIRTGEINFDSAPKISKEDYNKLREKCKGCNGDIFISKTGTVGLVSRVKTSRKFAITQNIAAITPIKEYVLPEFLELYFRTNIFRKAIFRTINVTTIPDMQLGDLKKVKLALPSLQEQKRISSILYLPEKEIKMLFKKMELYKNLKIGLMQQLLTGKIRVKVN